MKKNIIERNYMNSYTLEGNYENIRNIFLEALLPIVSTSFKVRKWKLCLSLITHLFATFFDNVWWFYDFLKWRSIWNFVINLMQFWHRFGYDSLRNENFSIFHDKITQTCRMTILKVKQDASKSQEYFRYLQNITKVPRKVFEGTIFMDHIFFGNLFWSSKCHRDMRERAFSKKCYPWKWALRNFSRYFCHVL